MNRKKQAPMDTTITRDEMVQVIKDLPDDATIEQVITDLVRLAKGTAG